MKKFRSFTVTMYPILYSNCGKKIIGNDSRDIQYKKTNIEPFKTGSNIT